MAIAKLRPDVEVPVDEILIEEMKEPHESIFTALVPLERPESLLTEVEGSPWPVWYYNQKLNGQTPINHFDVLEGALSQSYAEIKDMVLRVQSPLSYSYDNEKGIQSVTGSALVPLALKPMSGDVFIANIETGEDALFVITSSERKTFISNSLYEISYSSFSYTNKHPEYVMLLKQRVVESYYFDDRLNNGTKHSLITGTEKQAIDSLLGLLDETMSYYGEMFTHQKTRSLTLPGLDVLVYDPLLTSFIYDVVDFSNMTERGFRKYVVESIDYRRSTIWSCIRDRRLPNRNVVEEKIGYLSIGSFWRKAALGTLQFTDIKYIAHPIDPNRNHLSMTAGVSSSGTSLVINNYKNSLHYEALTIKVVTPEGDIDKALLHKLDGEGNYVVSETFYKYLNDSSLANEISYVEYLIAEFIRDKPLDKISLARVLETWQDWPTLHQFYLLPVMWCIVRNTLGVI